MTVLFVLLGILLIAGGVGCIFTPVATMLSAGYLVGIVLLVYGIFGIVRAVTEKGEVVDWILSILAIIVGIVALFRPGGTLVIDGILIYLLAAFFLVQGVLQIYKGIKSRKENSGWGWNIFAGILGLVVGIICIANPMVSVVTIGILIGLFFIEAGVSLCAIAMSGGGE